MNSQTLTDKLHARADAKLAAYCNERFGDLFELCGGYNQKKPRLEGDDATIMASQFGIKDVNNLPWHGAIWSLAEKTLFYALRDEWRAREIDEFMQQVESVKDISDT